jgi:hypothetical protein
MKIDQILHESLQKIPVVMRFQILGAAMCADRREQWRWVEPMLRGDIPRLKQLLKDSK